ncbi:MAG: hypothetical protein QXP01_07990 [Candidatus Hadarchaeum sp.]
MTIRYSLRFHASVLAGILAFLLVATPVSEAGLMYGLGAIPGSNTRLFQINNYNTPSPTISIIGSTGRRLGDIAISSSGTLYVVENVSSGNTNIYTANPNTAALSGPVFTLGAPGINSLAWTPGDVLFTYGSLSGNVWRIDLVTNTASLLTTLPSVGGDMAWDPTDGSLYAVGLDMRLYKINPGTGAFTLQGIMNLGGPFASIAVDYTGQMYATTALDNSAVLRYYSVNKNTGTSTLIADFTGLGLGTFGLGASVLPVPEPLSITLFAFGGLAGLVGLRYRFISQPRRSSVKTSKNQNPNPTVEI